MAKTTFSDVVIQGKVGAKVFSRNASGYYVKAWKKGSNPKSQAQLNQRNRQISSTSLWKGVPDDVKAQWDTFGKDYFCGKKNGVHVKTSGFMSYVSMCNIAQKGYFDCKRTTITHPSGVTLGTLSYELPSGAPTAAMGNNIRDTAGAPLSITLASMSINLSSLTVNFGLNFPDTVTTAPNFSDDVLGQPVGYMVAVSKPIGPGQRFVQGQSFQTIAVTDLFGAVSGWTSTTGVNIKIVGIDLTNFKRAPIKGQTSRATVYQISQNGQIKMIGSMDVTYT
jgi:hypothetical protein